MNAACVTRPFAVPMNMRMQPFFLWVCTDERKLEQTTSRTELGYLASQMTREHVVYTIPPYINYLDMRLVYVHFDHNYPNSSPKNLWIF